MEAEATEKTGAWMRASGAAELTPGMSFGKRPNLGWV